MRINLVNKHLSELLKNLWTNSLDKLFHRDGQ